MARVQISAVVDGVESGSALRLVADYRRWPEASDAIRSVQVEDAGDGTSISIWEVTFRGGLMRWSEQDSFDADALVHRFTLIEGDPHDFSGTWTAEPRDDGCMLKMLADFDLGMPSLRHVLDPIAIEALEDAIADVLHALFEGRIRLTDAEPAAMTTKGPEDDDGIDRSDGRRRGERGAEHQAPPVRPGRSGHVAHRAGSRQP